MEIFLSRRVIIAVKGGAVWNQAFVGAYESAPVGHSATSEFKDPSLGYWICQFRSQEDEEEESLQKRQGVGAACRDLGFFCVSFLQAFSRFIVARLSCQQVLGCCPSCGTKTGFESESEIDLRNRAECIRDLGQGGCWWIVSVYSHIGLEILEVELFFMGPW